MLVKNRAKVLNCWCMRRERHKTPWLSICSWRAIRWAGNVFRKLPALPSPPTWSISFWQNTSKIHQYSISKEYPEDSHLKIAHQGGNLEVGILISSPGNPKVPTPIILSFFCSKLIWVVFRGRRICFQECLTYKEPVWSFEKNIDRQDFSYSTSKRSPSNLMKRRK